MLENIEKHMHKSIFNPNTPEIATVNILWYNFPVFFSYAYVENISLLAKIN